MPKQVLARDVAYDLIPFAQRRSLHARLAEALEITLPRASATTIAFHYSKSCHAVESAEWKRAVKAIQYWEMAAEEAMEGIDHHQVTCIRTACCCSCCASMLHLACLLACLQVYVVRSHRGGSSEQSAVTCTQGLS